MNRRSRRQIAKVVRGENKRRQRVAIAREARDIEASTESEEVKAERRRMLKLGWWKRKGE